MGESIVRTDAYLIHPKHNSPNASKEQKEPRQEHQILFYSPADALRRAACQRASVQYMLDATIIIFITEQICKEAAWTETF